MALSLTTLFLTGICVIQFLVILMIAHKANHEQPAKIKQAERIIEVFETKPIVPTRDLSEDGSGFKQTNKTYEGVAVTMFLHSPNWFLRRMTMCVRNVRDNLPDNWAIQIFYTAKGQSKQAIDINVGLQRMIQRGEVILTLIPPEVTQIKKKYFEMWTERWLWANMVAPKVLTFGGNQVLCGNSPYSIGRS
jgi:hypothetical protein